MIRLADRYKVGCALWECEGPGQYPSTHFGERQGTEDVQTGRPVVPDRGGKCRGLPRGEGGVSLQCAVRERWEAVEGDISRCACWPSM